MNKLPYEIINKLSFYLDFHSYENLIKTSKKLKIIAYKDIKKKKIKAAKQIFKLFNDFKNNYVDLKFNRKGYLINFYKLLKNPHLYKNKKIQFMSRFQYFHYNVIPGEIAEGKLSYDKNTDSWHINLDTDFNYPKSHLLYEPFILPKSVRVILD